MNKPRQKEASKHVKSANGIEKFHEAIRFVHMHYRFFYYILKNIRIQETGDVFLAGVGYRPGDRMPTLFFNSQSFDKYKYKENTGTEEAPNWVEREYEPTYEELKGVIVHELLHVCQDIFNRQSTLGMNLQYANIAHDILINREIYALSNIKEGIKSLADFLVHASRYPSLAGQNLDEWSLPMVYDAIKKDSEASGGKGKIDLETLKKMIENGQLILDYHGFDEGEAGEGMEMTEEARAYLEDLIKQSAKECEREQNWGHLPGNMKRMIENLIKPKNKWRSTLEHFLQSCRTDTQVHTWKRHSRRYGNRASGRKFDNAPNLLIGIDTSGSIGQEAFDLFYSYMVYAAEHCQSIKVAFCDTSITYADELHGDQKSKFPKSPKGGGGTDMQPLFDHAKELGVDGVVLLTDGYCPTINPHNLPAIGLIVKGGQPAPGLRLNIDLE